jgi:transcription antitermination factor NusB
VDNDNSRNDSDFYAASDLAYVEPDHEPILNWSGPVKPDSQRAHRSLAYHFIYAVDRYEYSTSLDEIVSGYKSGFGLVLEDGAFSLAIASGVIEKKEELDSIIEPLLENWKIERLSCSARLVLRIAIWELLNSDTASTIVINEAVELAKAFAEEDAFRLVNGVLDKVVKGLPEKESVVLEKTDELENKE